MTDRDFFAAAALTGLLARYPKAPRDVGEVAYAAADLMLRERERTNLDAVPEAKAASSPLGNPVTAGLGTGNTPALTDAEREAVAYFAAFHQSPREADANAAAMLRSLLERMT